jgi:hypothetical protein
MSISPSTVDFSSLIVWYRSQCDGDWEHSYGIKLENIDNPGWLLTVDLAETDLEGATMATISEGCGPDDHSEKPRWIQCRVADGKFSGACDPDQVARPFAEFERFRKAAES